MPIGRLKNSLLIILLLLTACTGNPSDRTPSSVPQVSAPKTPDIITKPTTQPLSPPKPTKIYPWDFQVDLDKIDPDLREDRGKLQISYITEAETSPDGNCRYEAKYPQISGMRDTTLQEEINHKLWVKMTSGAYKHFQRKIEENYCARIDKSRFHSSDTTERCQIKFARGALVSLVCEEWHMPGAYPLIYQRGATFNIRTGQMYSIDDLWKPEVTYDRDIEPFLYTIKKVKNEDGTESISNISAAPGKRIRFGHLSNNGDFYLADRCENRENTTPPFITPPDLSKMTCIIFAKPGSGPERNINLSITTQEIDKFLNPDIAEVANAKP